MEGKRQRAGKGLLKNHQICIPADTCSIATANAVVAYRNFNNAFTFYYKKPIVILSSATAVSDYLKHYPSALVLERASWPHLKNSLPQLSVLNKDKYLFSRQYSIIYQLKSNQ